ncbi:hypothetical protein AGLY_001348 [Aphis glycines]|uniref:Uncharacterized protein n=1 Tax=Aphis glycines TaxID=307491 RepID=A0A6G0U6D0_APHGL|nr:hypothetical protein AGLY_001348 [Aphis glycines]
MVDPECEIIIYCAKATPSVPPITFENLIVSNDLSEDKVTGNHSTIIFTLNMKNIPTMYLNALTISTNSGFKDAPPTKNPSISHSLANSLQLDAVTDPPYIMRVVLATASFTSYNSFSLSSFTFFKGFTNTCDNRQSRLKSMIYFFSNELKQYNILRKYQPLGISADVQSDPKLPNRYQYLLTY